MICWFRAITTTAEERKNSLKWAAAWKGRDSVLFLHSNNMISVRGIHAPGTNEKTCGIELGGTRGGMHANRHNHHYCYFIIAIFDFENRLIARLKVDIDLMHTHTHTPQSRSAQNHLPALDIDLLAPCSDFSRVNFIFVCGWIYLLRIAKHWNEQYVCAVWMGVGSWEVRSESENEQSDCMLRIHLWQAQIIRFDINFFELMSTL